MTVSHVSALRSTWRNTRQHYEEQAKRFARIFVGVLIPQLLALDFHHVTRSALLALVAPALEVAFRQLFPALGAAGLDAAPGATIVPAEVGLPQPAPDVAAPDDTLDVDSVPTDLGHSDIQTALLVATFIGVALLLFGISPR